MGSVFVETWARLIRDVVRNHSQPATWAIWHFGIISNRIVTVITVLDTRRYIHQWRCTWIERRIIVNRWPKKRTTYDYPGAAMKIVKSMKTVASLLSATMIHAADVAMKAAIMPVKPVALRNRHIADGAQHQCGCRKP